MVSINGLTFEIRGENWQPHLDIENDLQKKGDGLFTFILRVNKGNIVDYVLMETSDGRKYKELAKRCAAMVAIVEKSVPSRHH
jgi:hypothetical protein